ncbi:MAG: hypothetical protein MJ137_06815 [Clostridia bacterium]|nr:hypothetical protein [Clostridia bacterium]
MKKRLFAVILALADLLGVCVFSLGAGADTTLDYPELIITEIGTDQFGDKSNPKNTNAKYNSSQANKDVFEFIEIYNNSDKKLNIYDYMLGYQGTGSDDTEFFESSVQEYTPFHAGADFTDSPYGATNKYWSSSKVEKPVNPPYEEGVIEPGEVFVVWMYNDGSHYLNCTTEQFRTFWSIPSGVKVFLLDADSADAEMNFSLKNSKTGTYIIMTQSERFPKRRSSDKTFYPESDNKHHNYYGKKYSELDEIINWAVVDFKTDPLASYAAANGGEFSETNYTLSYLPETSKSSSGNGASASTFISGKRSRLSAVNTYSEATVGTLTPEQKTALSGKIQSTVHTVKNTDIYSDPENNNTRPDLLITKISPDQYGRNTNGTNKEYTSYASDPYEFFELYNNSGKAVNIYDYMMGYQGSAASSVSTYFERLIQEYTAIFPGYDWADGPYTYLDSYWNGTSKKRPVNPSYEEGVIAPGETLILWMYSQDSNSIHAGFEDFRAFWSIPENVKVFIIDGNSSRDKNFNIKNSSTGTYVMMKPSSRFPQRRSDDETLDTENVKRFWSLDLTYIDVPEVVSWAVVDFGCYDPLYTFSGKNENSSMQNNYTLRYAPYDADRHEFVNGFLTTSIPTFKRCILLSVNKDYSSASVGILTDEQKTAIAKAFK